MTQADARAVDPWTTAMEPGIAAVFERRDARERGGRHRIRSIGEVTEALQAYFDLHAAGASPTGVRRVAGGASKEMFRFDLVGRDGDRSGYVLRMDPPLSAVESCRAREAEVCNALGAAVPVPRVPWVDGDGGLLGAPALIMELAAGSNQADDAIRKMDGLGFATDGELKRVLSRQFVDNLAAIHAFDWRTAELPSFQAPVGDPYQAARWQVNWWSHVWRSDAVLHMPAMAAVEVWLRANLPVCTDPVVVHGDYRSGNYFFDPADGRVTAIIDWEAAHLGDFHEDLGETMPRAFGSMSERGLLVSGLMSREDFLLAYEQRSGRTVDLATLHFYEVLAGYKCVALCLAAALRAAVEQQNHQDVHQTFLVSAGHAFAEELFELIEQAR